MTEATPALPVNKTQGTGRRTQAHGAFLGTGRRKTSIARLRLKAGAGKVMINSRELSKYFSEIQDREAVLAPLKAVNATSNWDVAATVIGGGHTGQAGAVKLALARALLRANTEYEPALRDSGYLTRDARAVERKKPGRRKARRSFQFSKR